MVIAKRGIMVEHSGECKIYLEFDEVVSDAFDTGEGR